MNLNNAARKCRIFKSLFILCCVVTIFGCNSNATNTSVGKYVDEKNPSDYTELKKDGTFLIHQGGMDVSGKYSIEDKRLILVLSSGKIITGSIEGKTITDNGGGRLIKQ